MTFEMFYLEVEYQYQPDPRAYQPDTRVYPPAGEFTLKDDFTQSQIRLKMLDY